MAKEYIEQETAKARLRIWITDCVLNGDNDAADCFRDCIDLLDSIPAADVISKGLYEQIKWERDVALAQLEEYGVSLGEKADVVKVRHGRWIRKEDDSCYWYECSECGEKLAKTQWGNDYFSAYCPNCGVLMDKEATNELD